jgi:hypothetical protein
MVRFKIGDRVEGGVTPQDYDTGMVADVSGNVVTINWDSNVVTTQAADMLRPEGAARPKSGPTVRFSDDGAICMVDEDGELRVATQADMDSLPVGEDLEDWEIKGALAESS